MTWMMKRQWLATPLAAALTMTLSLSPAYGHEDATADGSKADNKHLLHDTPNPDGHIPSNVNYGFSVIGRDTLGGISDGRYTDVWAHKGFAYVGTFQEPTCDRSGVYISDIRDPANPVTVKMIKSPPNTRINDVKVYSIAGKDVLIHTLEPCGKLAGKAPQRGQGGISLWDVSDPTNPHALKQNFLDFPVHNTFAWQPANGKTYLLIVDDIAANDLKIADISKPQSPKLLGETGIEDWLETNPEIADDGQLFTGTFAASLLHDIWVNDMDSGEGEDWHAVLSYWDAGFVVLDVNDPNNPVFIKDSTYPDPDPVLDSSPAEGNAHAAVFGGPGFDKIFGGDEDFDSLYSAVTVNGEDYAASQGNNVPQVGPGADIESLVGQTAFVGLACGSALTPASETGASIAVIERGECAFTTKAQTIEAAGYQAGIVFNAAAEGRCDATVSMLVDGGVPMVFVPRSSAYAILGIEGYDPALCPDNEADNPPLPTVDTWGLVATLGAAFDGWGYLHVLNNKNEDVTVKYGRDGDTRTVGYLGEIGYYAPSELTDPELATGAGDLTMHNLEIDPQYPNRAFISWYSLGMRAVEWREGHLHTNARGEGVNSWNMHEVGRFIAGDEYVDSSGSNFWGVHVTEVGGEQYILGSDRNTGLWIFQWSCEDVSDVFYCNMPQM
ncbi:PA domain-containing protein [Grimontia marina]|uniref:LVIVD repeat protein n=1 Tax=Grimontia marina TaxID=646534 RepID=A0A128FB94_9GAMM|nr:PA domain-containing protein [Grimontia marina]CZF84062.1 LVIVD repeat protein [Grimontia marina]